MRRRLTTLIAASALLGAGLGFATTGAARSAAAGSHGQAAPQLERAQGSGHPIPTGQKDTPYCNKLLRKYEKAYRKGQNAKSGKKRRRAQKRAKRLANKYNAECRTGTQNR